MLFVRCDSIRRDNRQVDAGIDIRDYGSGNIGASNVLRTLGLGPALLVFFFDTAKGLAAVVLCERLNLGSYVVVAGGLLSVLGHTFSMFLNFKGGKGVATSLGVILGLNLCIGLIGFAIWLFLLLVTRIISRRIDYRNDIGPGADVCVEVDGSAPALSGFGVCRGAGYRCKHIPNMKRLPMARNPE